MAGTSRRTQTCFHRIVYKDLICSHFFKWFWLKIWVQEGLHTGEPSAPQRRPQDMCEHRKCLQKFSSAWPPFFAMGYSSQVWCNAGGHLKFIDFLFSSDWCFDETQDLDYSSVCLTPSAHTVSSPEPWVPQGFNKYLSNAGMNHYKVTASQINLIQALPLISALGPPRAPLLSSTHSTCHSVPPITAMLIFWISCHKLNFHIFHPRVATLSKCRLSFRISFPIRLRQSVDWVLILILTHSSMDEAILWPLLVTVGLSPSQGGGGAQQPVHVKVHCAKYKPQHNRKT